MCKYFWLLCGRGQVHPLTGPFGNAVVLTGVIREPWRMVAVLNPAPSTTRNSEYDLAGSYSIRTDSRGQAQISTATTFRPKPPCTTSDLSLELPLATPPVVSRAAVPNENWFRCGTRNVAPRAIAVSVPFERGFFAAVARSLPSVRRENRRRP